MLISVHVHWARHHLDLTMTPAYTVFKNIVQWINWLLPSQSQGSWRKGRQTQQLFKGEGCWDRGIEPETVRATAEGHRYGSICIWQMVSHGRFVMARLVFLFAEEELGGVSVSAKVTELAKKNKQLCVEVEREKTKSRQSHTRIQALEKQVQSV